MPLGILTKLNTEVAHHILSLRESLLKLEKQSNFFVDCGDWEGWKDAFSSAIEEAFEIFKLSTFSFILINPRTRAGQVWLT